MASPHGKYVTVNPENPEAIGICDRTGLPALRKNLVRQMEYRGNSLQWTGLWVNKVFYDEPSPQQIAPVFPPDPIPIPDPRPGPMFNVVPLKLEDTGRALGGTPYSSAGGIPANAFDDNPLTACTQDAPNGNIYYNFYRRAGVQFVGIQSRPEREYSLTIEFSFNMTQWNYSSKIPTQVYPASTLVWFEIPNQASGTVWRVRETGGSILDLEEIYFNIPLSELYL